MFALMGKIYPYMTMDGKLIYVECNGHECKPIILKLRKRYKDIKLPCNTEPVDPGLELFVLRMYMKNNKRKKRIVEMLQAKHYNADFANMLVERVASLSRKQDHLRALEAIVKEQENETVCYF